MAGRYAFWLKVGTIVLVMLAFATFIMLPIHTYKHEADVGRPTVYGFRGFAAVETDPQAGYRFAWASAEATLQYPRVPRYTPLELRLRVNLQRPPEMAPLRLEIYERTIEPEGELRLVTTLEYQANDPKSNGPHDFLITIPTIPGGGKGLQLELRSNALQIGDDPRQLGFAFLESELSVPYTHLLSLFWPYPYLLAGLLMLAVVAAWSLRAGLTVLETGLLSGMVSFALATTAGSTYQYSWWSLAIAGAMWLVYLWEGQQLAHGKGGEIWPLLAATALLLTFFLFSGDEQQSDVGYYVTWGKAVHEHGIWNIYSYDIGLNYLPLIVYGLWFYNWIIYPLGLQESHLAWRVTACLMYLAVIALLYLISRGTGDGGRGTGDGGRVSGDGFQGTGDRFQVSGDDESPDTRHPSPDTRHPTPDTRHPTPDTRHPTPDTRHPTPDTRHPSPDTRQAGLILIAFNAGFFANPVIWGQSDIMAVVALTGTFFLVYRKQALWGGLALGLTAISKPQAWFVLPLLAWILVQRCGWRKGGGGLALGGILALSMATIAFGFDTKSVANYFNQPEFAGNYSYKYVTALNLNRLVVGSGQVTTVPSWLSLLGFVVVGLVMLGVLFTRTGRQNSLKRDGLAGTLLVVTCFSWLIKMKERYLIYSFPFLGIAALEDRRLFKPLLALSWLQLIQLLTTLFDYSPLKKVNLTFYPFLWTRVLSQDWSDYVLSTCTMLLFFYLGYVYLKQVRRTPKPDQTEPKPELQEAGNIK